MNLQSLSPASDFTREVSFKNRSYNVVVEEMVQGLKQRQKQMSPKFFYDENGSQLFEEICHTKEYYLTRCEEKILKRFAPHIADLMGSEGFLIELGSGASDKVHYLLDALHRPRAYMAVDISTKHLLEGTRRVAQTYKNLETIAVSADFHNDLDFLRSHEYGSNKIILFLGSSIGNMTPSESADFLKRLRQAMGEKGKILVGIDLKKDPKILEAAYNDRRGVTAEFNKNILWRLRRECGASIDPQLFQHRAFYNAKEGRVEMHLQSLIEQIVRIDNETIPFLEGETIHTENSYKYTIPEFCHLARAAALKSREVWIDDQGYYSLHLLTK